LGLALSSPLAAASSGPAGESAAPARSRGGGLVPVSVFSAGVAFVFSVPPSAGLVFDFAAGSVLRRSSGGEDGSATVAGGGAE